MIDTHAHLDMCADDADAVVARAEAAGVAQIVTIGSGIASCRESLEIAERHEGVSCALGVHPHQAGEVADGDLEKLRELLDHPRAVAVGETGLDFYRDLAPRSRQEEVFRAQVEIARDKGKPLVIHSRAADEATLAELEQAEGLTIILHCLSSELLAQATRERGYYGSFAGNVTYPRADELRAAARLVPSDRLLAETDSPYLSPQAVRGQPNEPAQVAHVYSALADAREQPLASCVEAIDENAARAFSL